MCPKNTYVLRISNRGEGVQNTAFGTKAIQVDGEDVDIQIPVSWTMNLPACLCSKGACNITVTYSAMETIENYSVLAIVSNIPQLGADTEQGLNSSAATRLATLSPSRDKPASDAQELYRQQFPHTFRCTGLPERLEFTRVCLVESDANSVVGHIPTPNSNPHSTNPITAANPYYAEVLMTIEFDGY